MAARSQEKAAYQQEIGKAMEERRALVASAQALWDRHRAEAEATQASLQTSLQEVCASTLLSALAPLL